MDNKTAERSAMPAPPASQPAQLANQPPKRKRTISLTWAIIGMVASLFVGVGIGQSGSETDTAQLQARLDAMEARAVAAEDRTAEYQQQIAGLQADVAGEENLQAELDDALAAIEAKDDRIAELQEQIDKLEKAAPAGGARTTITDGTWRVGEEIRPGTYRAPGGNSCYWERLSGFSGNVGDIIANDVFVKNPTVTIAPSDAGFHTADCGTWTRI